MTDAEPLPSPRARRHRADLVRPLKWIEPGIDELMKLSKAQQQAYSVRKLALEMYRCMASGEEIKNRTGMNITQVGRLHRRADSLNPVTNAPEGYYACLPNRQLHRKPHRRVQPFRADLATTGRGQKHALSCFLEEHPDIEKALLIYFRTRRLGNAAAEPKLSPASAVKAFHKLCRAKELHLAQPPAWPFNTSRVGENAIRAFYAKWRSQNQVVATGNEQGEHARYETETDLAVARNSSLEPVQLAPLYARVELDEVSLPVLSGVVVPTKDGLDVLVDARRFYGLLLIDHRIPLILAARLSFGPRYDVNDVLGTLRQALFPPGRLTLSIKGGEFDYLPEAGYPAEVLPGLKGSVWQRLAWDSDAAHVSASDSEVIKALLGCKVSGERLGEPTARQMVERLNGFLSRACSVLASATGTGPTDVVRRSPEEAVAKYDIRAEYLEQLLDVWARNWNATYRPSLGMSPLEAARQLMHKQEVFYNPFGEFATADHRHEFYPRFRRELRFSRNTHGLLAVNLFGAKYSSAELAGNALLANAPDKGCTLFVNDEDARIAWVVPNAYPELRIEVHVQNRRLRAFPHSLLQRRTIAWVEAKEGRYQRAITPDTMRGFSERLGEKAKAGDRDALNTVAAIQGEQHRLMAGGMSTTFPAVAAGEKLPLAVLDVEESDEAELDPEHAGLEQPRKRSAGRPRGRSKAPETPRAQPLPPQEGGSLPRVRGTDLGLGL